MPEHEIYYQRAESTSLTFTGGELKIRETDSSEGYGIRVLHDGRVGFSYCQRKKDLEAAMKQAEKLSRFSAKSDFSFAPDAKFKKLELYNRNLSPQDYEKLKSLVTDAKQAAESRGGKSRVIAEIGNSSISLENTAGFTGSYDLTEISLYAECMDADGFGLSYSSSNLKMPDGLELGMKAAEMAKSMQSAKKPDSGSYTVVMEIEALESLMEAVLPSFSGDWKRRGISKLKQDEKSFSEKLTVCDNPLSKGIDARPFDDEGTVSEKRCLINKGVVASFLYDRETAALEGVEEGGCCTRTSYANAPGIGSSNIVISPGDWKSFDELGRHLEVHYLHGSHTSNPTTGDIGLEVNSAFLVENGERKPVKGFMLTGNIFEMLSNIEGLEKKTKILDYLESPRIAFGNVHVVS